MKKEIDKQPITLYGQPMKVKEKEKYLGDYIGGSLSESVDSTVDTRCAKLSTTPSEIRAIIEDCRSQSLGGMTVGLDIWETAVVPCLLTNSQTWVDIKDKTVKKLYVFQDNFYRTLLSCPISTPRTSLAWDCGGVRFKFRIMQNKPHCAFAR